MDLMGIKLTRSPQRAPITYLEGFVAFGSLDDSKTYLFNIKDLSLEITIKLNEYYLDTKIEQIKKNGILLTKEGEDLYSKAKRLEKAIENQSYESVRNMYYNLQDYKLDSNKQYKALVKNFDKLFSKYTSSHKQP